MRSRTWEPVDETDVLSGPFPVWHQYPLHGVSGSKEFSWIVTLHDWCFLDPQPNFRSFSEWPKKKIFKFSRKLICISPCCVLCPRMFPNSVVSCGRPVPHGDWTAKGTTWQQEGWPWGHKLELLRKGLRAPGVEQLWPRASFLRYTEAAPWLRSCGHQGL